ncbi:hypothetical protein KUTeg_007128 [Tegillarca granosa]|uniref:Uncharacterized protein n=1 Tax=Tegillarca granosa TaxID=220873 RepID=A0ABQ9FCC4_TEGGR|nr:hypothetical protein KUTeg_007128 [Tegillarca granosa]
MTNTLLNKEIKPHENIENKTQERKYTALDLVRPLQMAILSLNTRNGISRRKSLYLFLYCWCCPNSS